MKKIFFLDAMALIYRAHFAFAKNHRYTSKGLNTSAIYGFLNTLLELLDKEKPTHIGVAFDLPGGTFRNQLYIPYKAQREETPNEIIASIPYIKKLLNAFQIPILELAGYEADDIIGTMAFQASDAGFDVYMVTPDKDYGQLLRENVFMYKPARSGGLVDIISEQDICSKYDIKKAVQFIDILGLWGDASDNIPGIPSIGEKTAQKLISEYGSVEAVIANADKIKGKVSEKIKEFAQQGLLSKELATICTTVPIEFHVEQLLLSPLDESKIKPILEELEFKTLTNRLFKNSVNVSRETTVMHNTQNAAQSSLFEEEGDNSEIDLLNTFNCYDVKKVQYKSLNSIEEIKSLLEALLVQKEVAFDTETTGLDCFVNDIIGLSFCYKVNEAFYIPILDSKYRLEVLELLKPFFSSDILLVGQNIKFDLKMLFKYNIYPKNPLFDTMIAHYILHSEQKHNLDAISKKYLNYQSIPIESLIGKKGKNQLSMQSVDLETITIYACEDADLTFRLYNVFKKSLERDEMEQLFYNIEMPLVNILALMENEGVNLDVDFLKKYDLELGQKVNQIEEEIFHLANKTFNINSPKQLGEILFIDLDLHKGKKKNNLSTAEDVLIKLIGEHPIVEKVLEYRSLQKLRSTYINALPQLVSSDGCLHTVYNQALTTTGRLSSNNPNLQNIPIKTEQGKEIRKAFIPKNDNSLLISADYSQIELRIIAAISGDVNMCKAFQKGIDIHTATAANLFEVKLEEVTSEMRRKAKTVNFGIIYGISAFGLSERLNISRTEASEIIKQYFMAFPAIKTYMDKTIQQTKEKGYTETLLGRKRLMPEINNINKTQREFAERAAINAPIQGTSADMIKLAMIEVQSQIKQHNFKAKLILQVHDELIFDVPKNEVELLKPIIITAMKNALPLSVPIEVGIAEGKNWLEAH